MTELTRKRIKTILASSFLVLFIGYYGSISLFYHTHLVLGDSIVHSHPFKADSNGKPLHSHTEKGLITIQLLSSSFAATLPVIFALAACLPDFSELIQNFREGIVFNSHQFHYSLRGPPYAVLK